MNFTHYITQEPFQGSVRTGCYSRDGELYAAYSGDLGYNPDGSNNDITAAEYCALQPGLKIITSDEADRLFDDFEQTLVTKPKEISEDDYQYALEVLPPSKFDPSTGSFHVVERLRGDLVNWYTHKKKRGRSASCCPCRR